MNWQERAEKAEAELAKLQEQKPVAWCDPIEFRDDPWSFQGFRQRTQRYPTMALYAAPNIKHSTLTADDIFQHIKHGDEDHQKWLETELIKLFSDVLIEQQPIASDDIKYFLQELSLQPKHLDCTCFHCENVDKARALLSSSGM